MSSMRMLRSIRRWPTAAVLAWFLAGSGWAAGQQVQQTIALKPGWNAVFLEVDAEPSGLDDLLRELPVASVWLHDPVLPRSSSGACSGDIESATCPITTPIRWRVWFAEGHPAHAISSLRDLQGGRAYLIEATGPAVFSVNGVPTGRQTEWKQGFNLTGFHVAHSAGAAPSFASFLSGSPVDVDTKIFEVASDGSLARIADPDQRRIAAGGAYWVEAARNGAFDGPVRVDASSLRGVQFSGGSTQHLLSVENITDKPRVLYVEPVAASGSENAAAVPLVWRDLDQQGPDAWRPIDQLNIHLAAKGATGSRNSIRLATTALGASAEGAPSAAQYGLLRISDHNGFERIIGVRTRPDDQSGLWVGDVTVTHVLPLTVDEGPDPTPVGTPFIFRVIIHKSASDFRLLSDVVLAYQKDEGTFALVTSDCPQLLNAEQVSPRISSANFSFAHPATLVGEFNTSLSVQSPLTVDGDDALNPFRHAFNPIHETGWDIKREPKFVFDPDGGGDPDWGVTWLAGDYFENVTISDPSDSTRRIFIKTQGMFELRRISNVWQLCTP